MKKRIWELDCLRGVLLLLMIFVHLAYDLIYLFGVWEAGNSPIFEFLRDWAGMPFIVLSGLCATLGKHPVKRGIGVFLGGMACTAVTWGMYRLGFSGKGIVIYFGVLHCLGSCMLLWPLLRKLPAPVMAAAGAVMVAAGLYLTRNVSVPYPWLMPLGVPPRGFSTSDYFPLLPNLGYFLIGGALGRWCYREKSTRFPGVSEKNVLRRFFCFLGRHSLLIYLLHQPALAAILFLFLG